MMKTLTTDTTDSETNPQSRVTVTASYNGFEFDYLSEDWILNRNITVNTAFIDTFESLLAYDIRETLTYFAENNSATHVRNISDNLKLYLRTSKVDVFSEQGFINFKNSLLKKQEYKLSVVRGFIRQMRYLGLNDHISDEVYELTDRWRLSGNEKGAAVLSLDPEAGPFSDTEFEGIGHKAAQLYARGKLSTKDYATILIYKATGRRTEQISSLKVKDFMYTSTYTSPPTYVVNIPRAKQRNEKFRTSFKPFGLIKTVAQVIELHIEESKKIVEKAINRKLTTQEYGELPLFLNGGYCQSYFNSRDEFFDFLKSELSHMVNGDLSRQLVSAVKKLKIVSERTGKLIHVNPYRFRYTLGTRAAREGAGEITIATLLDHSTMQNTSVYVANVPEHAVEISKIMNQPLARYAAAFEGKLVENESEANKENPGATRIALREKNCEVGSCGTNSFCQDYAPIACYLCDKYRPWVHAPHYLVLQWLMDERERLKSDTDSDMQVVVINDRAIIAVCQVIKLCEEYLND